MPIGVKTGWCSCVLRVPWTMCTVHGLRTDNGQIPISWQPKFKYQSQINIRHFDMTFLVFCRNNGWLSTLCTKMSIDESVENTPNDQNLSAKIVCPSQVWELDEIRLHWASVVCGTCCVCLCAPIDFTRIYNRIYCKIMAETNWFSSSAKIRYRCEIYLS